MASGMGSSHYYALGGLQRLAGMGSVWLGLAFGSSHKVQAAHQGVVLEVQLERNFGQSIEEEAGLSGTLTRCSKQILE